MKKIYRIDGRRFSTLEEFYDEISAQVIPGVEWGCNLDAFNDILRGGFGTPENGFILIWENSKLSRERLGYQETVRQLEKRLARCHPSNTKSVTQEIEKAKGHEGSTVFEWLVEIIRDHGPDGDEPEDGVELELR